MKVFFKVEFLAATFACIAPAVAQTSDTIFYNKNWLPTAHGPDAMYFRLPAVKEGDGWRVTDYYLSGKPQMTALVTSPDMIIQEGHFIYFDSLGRRIREGQKLKGMRTGLWTNYWPGTELKVMTITYTHDMRTGLATYFDSTSQKIIATGNFMDGAKHGGWNYYVPGTDYVKALVTYYFGRRHGKHVEYFSNGRVKREAEYEKDILKDGVQFDEEGKRVKFVPLSYVPHKELELLSEKLVLALNAQGGVPTTGERAVVQFTVSGAGVVDGVQFLDSLSSQSANAAIRLAISERKKWKIPPRHEGVAAPAIVRARMVFTTPPTLRFTVRVEGALSDAVGDE